MSDVRLPPYYVEVERVYAQTIGRGMRSVAVVSAEQEEGVTTLAVALAERNRLVERSTLLVDLNLHRPRIDEIFGVRRQPTDSSHGATAIPITHIDDKFSVLAAPSSRNENVLFRERQHFAELLEGWHKHYDSVIFDTSPLNAQNRGNIPPERVCGACDGSVLVVLAGRTPASAVRIAMEKLAAAEVELTGSVLNDQFNPRLADELTRETRRLDRFMPWITRRLRGVIRRSQLLNVET